MNKLKKFFIASIIIISSFFLTTYTIWRIFTIPILKGGIISCIIAIILILVEISGIFDTFVYYYNSNNQFYPKLLDIEPEIYPDIDILVTIYNEPAGLLKKTILACLGLKYPDKDKVHIFICDDGNREEIEKLAKDLKVGYFPRKDRKNAKSGNLNNGLKNTKSYLVANFDVDMIPENDFLIKTVPYFFNKDPSRIGFVQTPQGFYKPDLFQSYLFAENIMPNEQEFFYKSIQISKNKFNSVIYGGTNAVFLRKALEDAGGFSKISITEDFATGILIQSKGYKALAINKVLAKGLPPSSLKALCRQRQRWARGCIQTGKRLGILRRNDLNFEQKINYLSSVFYWYFPLKQFLYIITPIIFSVFGIVIAKCNFAQVLIFWLPMQILSALTLRILSKNTRTFHQTRMYETILSPSLVLPVLCEIIGFSKNEFVVTDKEKSADSLIYRIGFIIPNLILSVFTVVGISKCLDWILLQHEFNQFTTLFWLICNFYFLSASIFFAFGRTEAKFFENKLIVKIKDIFRKSMIPFLLMICCLILCIPILIISNTRSKFPVMKRGINIGNCFEAPKDIPWDMDIKNEYLDAIKEKGFDHVRIPVRFSDYFDEKKGSMIDPVFLKKVDEYVDYALSKKLTVILDFHHYDEVMKNPSVEEWKFYMIWRQLSEHYRNYPKELVFELLNEPKDELTPSLWNKFIKTSVTTIREQNPNRIIIIGPYFFYNINFIYQLELPKNDPHIMLAFHYYEPYEFAFQGNQYHPEYAEIKDIPWNANKRELKYLSDRFEKIANWAREKKVKVILNEFGVTKEVQTEDRALWIKETIREAEKNNFAWTYWELGSGFGVFDTKTLKWDDEIFNEEIFSDKSVDSFLESVFKTLKIPNFR
ncbi:MAG: cellulase family glycosylhydrolase [Oscillospiraceae bacterium]|jgi:cellulose synthase/poly-beta-1,6-N-acetylglucosamine synthase-like glycosyltransferase/aryl-phospho-beta-D-glucosidase BglC (GH1 family)|nr:cellulase family glycosylhydrolase [Oscillospiraceae bacterium]